MVPEGTSSQNPPGHSDEPILARVERTHRQIVHSTFMALVRGHERTETRRVADAYYHEEGGSG
jgi:hypothetical protein